MRRQNAQDRAAGEGGRITAKNWRWTVGVAVLTVAVLLLLFCRWRQLGFDWRLFGETLVHLNWMWLTGAAVFALASYYGRALRWAAMIRPYKARPNLWNLTSATAVGFAAIMLLGRPAEFVRPYLISVREKVPFSSQVAAWLLERIFDLLTALVIFGFALSQVGNSAAFGPGLQWVVRIGGNFVAVVGALCLGILLLFRHFSAAVRRRVLDALAFLPAGHHKKVDELVTAFAQGAEATRDRFALFAIFAYTVIEWILIAGCYFCMVRAFPGLSHLRVADVFALMGFVAFGGVVQIPGIGGGVQIVAIVVLTEMFRIPLELASSVALILWVLTFVVIVPPGLVLAFHEGINWRKIREIEEKASV